ncbi:uncharacterized protein N7511_007267 [Penicillium nucicola]|uniref:uncharacterized protein n=1 Tax=Penicillium nucicola TaxID=1850975 RepID=UPI0025458F90|nr:uncharacterized protein N7511_007267 [Penicillium nucicola]KAJ5757085.1 hypothetical protein N7511_007267 [Penicillium nucicola]
MSMPETDISDMSSPPRSGDDNSASSRPSLSSAVGYVLGATGTESTETVSAEVVFSSTGPSSETLDSTASLDMTRGQGHLPVPPTYILDVPTTDTPALNKAQPAVACIGTLREEPFSGPARGSSRFGGLMANAGAPAASAIKSVAGLGHDTSFVRKPCAKNSVGQERQAQQQHLCARSLRSLDQISGSRERSSPATLPGMEMLGGLLMADNQGNQVSMDSAQAQMSQVHSLRAGIQRAETQTANSQLQRFQRAQSQQLVVTLPVNVELANARVDPPVRQRRPALAKGNESPSFFQRVLDELNSARGTSQSETQLVHRPGRQELPVSNIRRDYAMSEREECSGLGQKTQSDLDLNIGCSSVNKASEHTSGQPTMNHQPSFDGKSFGRLTLAGDHESEKLSTGFFKRPSSGVSYNATPAKRQPVASFSPPAPVSYSNRTGLNLDGPAPSGPGCKSTPGIKHEFNEALDGWGSIPTYSSPSVLGNPSAPGVPFQAAIHLVASDDPLAQLNRDEILNVANSPLHHNPTDSERHIHVSNIVH